MTTTNLGSGMARPTVASRDELVFQSDIEGLLTRAMSQLETRLQQYVNARLVVPKDPVVNVTVPTPSVNVAAASLPNLPAPTIDLEVEVPGLEALAAAQAETNVLLRDLKMLLSRPVIKTVERDTDDLITRVTETR